MASRESLWEELERADAQIAQLMGERAQLGAQLSKAWQKSRGLAKELEARERDLEAAERHAEELEARERDLEAAERHAEELEARERDLEAAERHAEELSASLAKAQASSTVCACAQ